MTTGTYAEPALPDTTGAVLAGRAPAERRRAMLRRAVALGVALTLGGLALPRIAGAGWPDILRALSSIYAPALAVCTISEDNLGALPLA